MIKVHCLQDVRLKGQFSRMLGMEEGGLCYGGPEIKVNVVVWE